MKQWYEKLFENNGIKYDNEVFSQGTVGERGFIDQEIALNKGSRILDIGCGTDGHSIELAGRGYNVVGVDPAKGEEQGRPAEPAYRISET